MFARRKRSFFLFFILFFAAALREPAADVFIGNVSTGLLQIDHFRYPVYLYVPKDYKADREYPFIVSLPGDAESAEKHIQEWMGFLNRKSIIVMVPGLRPRDGEVPYNTDIWLLDAIKEVAGRYHLDRGKTYLVGKESGAHYAAYLAVKYPQEFSAAAFLGGSWIGPFDALIEPRTRTTKQLPFFISIPASDARLVERTETKAREFEKRGYPVYFETVTDKSEFAALEFKKRLFGWLEDKSKDWRKIVDQSKKTFKERFFSGIENFVST